MKRVATIAIMGALALAGCGAPTYPANVSVVGCQVSVNWDGTANADVLLSNTGATQSNVPVQITIEFYGGSTDDNVGLLAPPEWTVPNGESDVSHRFTAHGEPVGCSGKLWPNN